MCFIGMVCNFLCKSLPFFFEGPAGSLVMVSFISDLPSVQGEDHEAPTQAGCPGLGIGLLLMNTICFVRASALLKGVTKIN